MKYFFRWLGKDLKEIGITFREGDWKTKLSFLIMGFGQLLRGQIVRGIAMLALEGGLLYFIIDFGWNYLSKILTLGTVETYKDADLSLAPQHPPEQGSGAAPEARQTPAHQRRGPRLALRQEL